MSSRAASSTTTGSASAGVMLTPRRSQPRRRRGLTYATNLLMAGLVGAAVLICGLAVALTLTGHVLEQVTTGSMVPTIPVGSLVVTSPVPASQLGVGDVIAFQRPVNPALTSQRPEVIVHRIAEVSRGPGGTVEVLTKGDANPTSDCWAPPNCRVEIAATATANQVSRVYPGLGFLAALFRLGAIVLLPLVLIYVLVRWAIDAIRRERAQA